MGFADLGLAQTCTSMADDVASDSIWNSKSHSDAGLIHRGDMVNCLLGAACRCQCSVGVPVMTRRVGLRSSQGARGSHMSWGSRGNHPTKEVGSKYRIVLEGLTKVLTDQDELLVRKGCWVHQHSREGQSRK